MEIARIKQLMEQAEMKPELVDRICEALQGYATTIKEQYEEEYTQKLERAKQVCIEETNAHKRDLSKKLQIFCESSVMRVEQDARKQVTMRESKANDKLKELKAVLEGIDITPNGDLGQIKNLKKKLTALQEDRKKAVAAAKRNHELAEKVIKRNRLLERQITESQRGDGKGQTVTEGKGQVNRRAKPLGQRQSQQAATTRRTLAENQQVRGRTQRTSTPGSYGPTEIAAAMEEM